MRVLPSPLPGLVYLQPDVFADERGWFLVAWREEDLREMDGWRPFVQESLSGSRRGVLRGLHLQRRRPQGKLVRVVAGEIYDVAVDVRAGSPTFGRWHAERMAEGGPAAWIPPGFAHGFYALSEAAAVLYQVTDAWDPGDEVTIRWDDPALGIAWPLAGPPLLSPRDAAAPGLREAMGG